MPQFTLWARYVTKVFALPIDIWKSLWMDGLAVFCNYPKLVLLRSFYIKSL